MCCQMGAFFKISTTEGTDYQHLTRSAFVDLCLCLSVCENQPLKVYNKGALHYLDYQQLLSSKIRHDPDLKGVEY